MYGSCLREATVQGSDTAIGLMQAELRKRGAPRKSRKLSLAMEESAHTDLTGSE